MLEHGWKQKPNDYPTSDGKPMAETDTHRNLMFASIDTLQRHFESQPLVYVTGNILWFYCQGDRRRHLSPDLMVCFGIPKGERQNYLMWEEDCVPQVVFEFTSASTRANDLGPKRDRYEALGVEEYYIFDPRKKPLTHRLRTFHRLNGRFVPVLGEVVHSPRLGLEIMVADHTMRFRDPLSGEVLDKWPEREQRQAARANREAARAEQEAARAEQESARAEKEAARANREAALRLEAERELAELKRLLQRSGDSP